jgi:hypothetical protein
VSSNGTAPVVSVGRVLLVVDTADNGARLVIAETSDLTRPRLSCSSWIVSCSEGQLKPASATAATGSRHHL